MLLGLSGEIVSTLQSKLRGQEDKSVKPSKRRSEKVLNTESACLDNDKIGLGMNQEIVNIGSH